MKKNYSYVCVLSTDNYINGVLVLNENLKMIGAQYPLICLVNETISEENLNILDYFKIKYKKVNKEYYSTIKCEFTYWKDTYDVINVFNLTRFDKIVYLDVDLLILKNIDFLFKEKSLSMVKDVRNNNELFNTGVMVIEPNKKDYNNLVKLKDLYDEQKRENSVKELINDYFKGKINELDKEYNVLKDIQLSEYVNRYFYYSERSNSCLKVKNHYEEYYKKKENAIINHYCGKVKPFTLKVLFDCKDSLLYLFYLNKVLEKKEKADYGKELISVIIPVYNKEKYLDNTLKSIIRQTYKKIEIILVNDGSTDKSLEIMKEYQKDDPRIKIISIPNQGVSHARNTGLKNATGDYIMFLDSDDVVDRRILEKLYKDIKENNVDFVQCNNYMNKKKICFSYDDYRLNDKTEVFYFFLAGYISCTIWGKLYKRELLEDIRFNEKYNNHEDELFTYDVIKKCDTLYLDKEYLYHYTRLKDKSLTKKKLNKKDTELFIMMFNDMIDYTLKYYPDLLPKAKHLIHLKIYYLKEVKKDVSIKDFNLTNATDVVKEIVTEYFIKYKNKSLKELNYLLNI